MTETSDPLKALDAKSIADRAAGARDLSLVGELTHLEQLAAMAGSDRSPAVRLSVAAAAADILSRHRFGPHAKGLGVKRRNTLTELFRRIDPSVNPGVFSVFGCLDRPAALEAICGGLRDPRGDVRLGAAVGLLRLCTSQAVAAKSKVERTVVALLEDDRHKPDAVAEIARVCAAAGYRSAIPLIRALCLSGAHGELAAEALTILEAGEAPLTGMWFSDGLDAGETNRTSPLGGALVFCDGRTALVLDGGRWKVDKALLSDEVRRMHFRKVGAVAAAPAFQAGDRTWYSGADSGLLCVIDGLASPGEIDWTKLGTVSAASKRGLARADEHLPDTAQGHRARALLQAQAGDLAGAIEALEKAISLKKVFPDTWGLLGDALWAAGKKKAAKGHYRTFLKKARKKDFPDRYARAQERTG